MKLSFTCYGHPNITASHATTFEFTKDDFVTKTGDCIVGCKADFDLKEVKEFISQTADHKIRITIECDGARETVNAMINPSFSNEREMVIRKSDFISERTFAIRADKASIDFAPALVDTIKSGVLRISVEKR